MKASVIPRDCTLFEAIDGSKWLNYNMLHCSAPLYPKTTLPLALRNNSGRDNDKLPFLTEPSMGFGVDVATHLRELWNKPAENAI